MSTQATTLLCPSLEDVENSSDSEYFTEAAKNVIRKEFYAAESTKLFLRIRNPYWDRENEKISAPDEVVRVLEIVLAKIAEEIDECLKSFCEKYRNGDGDIDSGYNELFRCYCRWYDIDSPERRRLVISRVIMHMSDFATV